MLELFDQLGHPGDIGPDATGILAHQTIQEAQLPIISISRSTRALNRFSAQSYRVFGALFGNPTNLAPNATVFRPHATDFSPTTTAALSYQVFLTQANPMYMTCTNLSLLFPEGHDHHSPM